VRMRSREPIATTTQMPATPTMIRLMSSAIVVKPWR
jgi:hypothetical protein